MISKERTKNGIFFNFEAIEQRLIFLITFSILIAQRENELVEINEEGSLTHLL